MQSNFTQIIRDHKIHALKVLESYIDTIMKSNPDTANKFCYWLEDYATFLSQENDFSPRQLKRYKRGEIIKAHLGFNIGSEEGGLHYCVVIDKKNALSSPVVTVVPLTSLKPGRDKRHMRQGEVFIGYDFNRKLQDKASNLTKQTFEILEQLNHNKIDDTNCIDILQRATELISQSEKIAQEITKIKEGSIALVGQITTISKMRIYTPKTTHDALANIKLSSGVLDKIDEEIMKNFIGIK